MKPLVSLVLKSFTKVIILTITGYKYNVFHLYRDMKVVNYKVTGVKIILIYE